MGERVFLRLVIGHESTKLQRPVERAQGGPLLTHRWRVFVTAPSGQLDSRLVQRVTFQLHEDFANSRRVLKAPPYEVSENGYAGFTLPILVDFVACKRTYTLSYDLNLRLGLSDSQKITKILEFRDPKPLLRESLLLFGAEVKSSDGNSGHTQPQTKHAPAPPKKPSQFESLFGPTLALNVPAKKPVPNYIKHSSPSTRTTDGAAANSSAKTSPAPCSASTSATPCNSLPPPSAPPRVLTPDGAPADRNGAERQSKEKKKRRRERSDGELGADDGRLKKKKKKKKHKRERQSPSTSDGSGRFDETLVQQLVNDFGGDAKAADEIVSAAAARADSPLFATGATPERVPSTADRADDARTPRLPRSPSPPQPADAPPLEPTRRPPQPADAPPLEPTRLKRLLSLQRRLMTLKNPQTVLQVAQIIQDNVPCELSDSFLDFDLYSLTSDVVSQLFALFDTPANGDVQ